jgi:predicted phage terminase large subunit-like protein
MNYNEILSNLERLKTPIDEIARSNIFIYMLLFNKEIEPNRNYTEKFFTILSYKIQEFQESDEHDLFLLEASPRTGKTEFLIYIYLTWLLGVKEGLRFLIITNQKDVKNNIRRFLERMMKSEMYLRLFPEAKILKSNEYFMETGNGHLISFKTTKASVPTGAGFHFHFFIDFLTPPDLESDASLNFAFDQYRGFATRTQTDPPTKTIVDNQRLGKGDFSDYILRNFEEMDISYMRLTLPYQFEESKEFEVNGSKILFGQGEYLVDRFNDKEKKKWIAKLGTYDFNTQFLQHVTDKKGGLIQRHMFNYYRREHLEGLVVKKAFITTDLALTVTKRSDYNVFCYWIYCEEGNLYLINMFRMKKRGSEAEKALYNFYVQHSNSEWGVDFIIMENVSNTKLTIQRYEDGFEVNGKTVKLGGVIKKLERVGTRKFSRFTRTMPFIENGRVFLPSTEMKIDGVEDVNDDVVEPILKEYEAFSDDDSHKHDDIVDNFTDAIDEVFERQMDYDIGF